MRNKTLFAACKIFDFHIWPFVSEKNGEARTLLFRVAKLFSDLFGSQRIIDPVVVVAKRLNLGESIGSTLFFGDDNIEIEVLLASNSFLHSRFRGGSGID